MLKSLFSHLQRFWRLMRSDPRDLCLRNRRIVRALTLTALVLASLALGTMTMMFGSLYFVKTRLLSYFSTLQRL